MRVEIVTISFPIHVKPIHRLAITWGADWSGTRPLAARQGCGSYTRTQKSRGGGGGTYSMVGERNTRHMRARHGMGKGDNIASRSETDHGQEHACERRHRIP